MVVGQREKVRKEILTITAPCIIDSFCLYFIDNNSEFGFSKLDIKLATWCIQIFDFYCLEGIPNWFFEVALWLIDDDCSEVAGRS